MVLLQLAEDGVKYIKQNMCDKKTGMTQPFSAWNVQYEIRRTSFPVWIWKLSV